jgi:hypothetical protein
LSSRSEENDPSDPPDNTETPEAKLTALIGPLLANLSAAERPAVIAMAERIAADRYRDWSSRVEDEGARSSLLACAAREDEIASKVEAIVPGAAAIQAKVRSAHSGVAEGYQALFRNLSLSEQFSFQARAERAGVSVWRASAAAASDDDRPVYLECAVLEETSAEVLEKLVDEGVAEKRA